MIAEVLIPIVAILTVFGVPAYALKRIFDLRERKLEDKKRGEIGEVDELRREKKLLQERVENLESIVCSVDYELNQQIRQLVSGQIQVRGALGEGEAEGAGAAPGGSAGAGERGAGAGREGAADSGLESTALDVGAAGRQRGKGVARPAAELEAGSVLANRYQIQRLLGRGGMGAVYQAHDEVLDETVALKVISAGLAAADPAEVADRFRREASAARRVSSPNVIRIHDLGETRDGLLYMSMEYFAGKTLANVLERRGALEDGDCRDLVGQVCDGLAAAHGAGIVHRDLKPQNVLVGERNAVKLIDFGLAKAAFHQGMTATGLILGTPEYMSPEQVKGLEVDARSDIYSLGALTYHAVCGRPPFEGGSPIAVGFAHLTETLRPPRELRKGISRKLEGAIVAALAKNPADRPRSVEEFRRAL